MVSEEFYSLSHQAFGAAIGLADDVWRYNSVVADALAPRRASERVAETVAAALDEPELREHTALATAIVLRLASWLPLGT